MNTTYVENQASTRSEDKAGPSDDSLPSPAHSPLPWKVSGSFCRSRPKDWRRDSTTYWLITTEQGDPVYPAPSDEQAAANAAYLVHAANAYPALVEALQGVVTMLNTNLRSYDDEPWTQRVRAALALAERKE